jgi:hypothetical protein
MLLKKGSVRVLACNKVGVAKVVKAGHWQEIIFIISLKYELRLLNLNLNLTVGLFSREIGLSLSMVITRSIKFK